ncbi:MAG: hypothetical protein AAFP88_02150 [Bacteroidota bacterium]
MAASNEPFFRMNLSPIGAYHTNLRYEDFKPLPITARRIDARANFQAIRYQVREIMRAGK